LRLGAVRLEEKENKFLLKSNSLKPQVSSLIKGNGDKSPCSTLDITMKLDVVTPAGLKLSMDEVHEVILPSVLGEMGILPGHVPIFAALDIGRMIVKKQNFMKIYALNSGFIELSEDKIIVLTETCEEASEIDEERASRAKNRTEDALKNLNPSDGEKYNSAVSALKRAETRLAVKSSHI
jgi:F-type H+-transporting ATPase subunit epsilon